VFIYWYLWVNVLLLIILAIQPKQVSGVIKKNLVWKPFLMVFAAVLIIFFRSKYAEYQSNFQQLPEDIKRDKESIDYIKW
jgi:preprotein translocase subunit SecY